MHRRFLARLIVGLSVAVTASVVCSATALAAAPAKLTVISKGSTGSLSGAGVTGADGMATRERRGPKRKGLSPLRTDPLSEGPILQSGGGSPSVGSAGKPQSRPELLLGWEGLNHRDSRLSDNGNKFSGEPSDMALCTGNGFVLQSVNSAVRVFNGSDGSPASPVLALNQFYGFPSEFVRPAGPFGPFTFDTSCHYDRLSNRWFHLAVDLEQDTVTSEFTGRNYLDLAVSDSGDPRGSWTVYRIPGMNDGTEGTPNHNCAGGVCFADFPHIGMDKYGLYITTNEFPFFADGFTGAQVYAISKKALVNRSMSINVFLWNTADDPVRPDEPGFTVWPALSPKTFDLTNNGTEHFVSSNAVFDDVSTDSEELVLWRLTNTKSLESSSPAPVLSKAIVGVNRYTVPPASPQKSGNAPLLDCLNDTADTFGPGLGCWAAITGFGPIGEVLGPIDTSDSRVLDVRYANGKIWSVLGTGANVAGVERAGIGWYIVKPSSGGGGVVEKQGILATAGESLAYPTLGVTDGGRGVLGFTRVGEDLFPSAGYSAIDAKVGAVEVKMAAEGNAAQDGFTEYLTFSNRPRWGDYGAAAVDGQTIYLASGYIAQGACDIAEFVSTGFSCTGTRTSLANWSSRISKLKQ